MSLEEHKRRERAQAIGLFRYQLICPALDDRGCPPSSGESWCARSPPAPIPTRSATRSASRGDTLDRWIRRYRAGGFEALVPATAPAGRPHRRAGAGAGGRAEAGEPGPHRRAGGPDPAHRHRVGALGVDPAAPFPPAGADGPGRRRRSRRCSAGSRPPTPTSCGSATRCTARGSAAAKPTCSRSSTTIPGWWPATGSGSPRTPCAWPPRCSPALAARGVPAGDLRRQRLRLRRCVAAAGVRETRDPAGALRPGRPQGRGKIERFFRTVRDQFLVEVTDTTAEDLAAAGVDHAAALLELNRLFTAWVETEYHRRDPFRDRADAAGPLGGRLGPAGRAPAMPTAGDLTEAFLWSRVPHGHQDRDRVAARQHLPGRRRAGRAARSSWCSPRSTWKPIEVRYRDQSFGAAVPHTITRHAHPKARPETPTGAAAGDRDRLPGADRRRPPPAAAPRRTHRLPRPLPATHRTARSAPGQLPASTTPRPTTPQRATHDGRGVGVSIQRLQSHWGFTRMPFGRDLAPAHAAPPRRPRRSRRPDQLVRGPTRASG